MAVYDQHDDLDEYEDDFIDDQDGDVGGIKYKKGVVAEYEDELEEEKEDEEGEEEEPVAKEALKVLEYRQKVKEQLRAELRRENGDSITMLEDQGSNPPLKNFGSFFGPSRPVIADRVVQESKALLEAQRLVSKVSTSKNNEQMVNKPPSISGAKNGASRQSLAEQVKSKAQIIKDTRDYSFLLSDDIDVPKQPTTTRDPGPLKNLAQLPAQSIKPSGHSGSKVVNGHEQRKPLGIPRVGSTCTAPVRKSTSDNWSNVAVLDSKRQADLRKQPPTNNRVSSSTGRGIARSATSQVLPPKKSSSSMDKILLMEKKAPGVCVGHKVPPISKHSVSSGQRQPVGTGVSNGSVQHGRDNGVLQENSGGSKVQIKPPKQGYTPATVDRENPRMQKLPRQLSTCNQSGGVKKGSVNRKRTFEEDDDADDYRSIIRKMFRRPNKYVDDDDDEDMCTEVGFHTILKEESRSARIAIREDEEELAKIMEEERQEQLRKKAKMSKICPRSIREDEEELAKIMEEERQQQLRKKAKMRKICQR